MKLQKIGKVVGCLKIILYTKGLRNVYQGEDYRLTEHCFYVFYKKSSISQVDSCSVTEKFKIESMELISRKIHFKIKCQHLLISNTKH